MPDGLLLCRLGIDDHQGQSDFDQLFAIGFGHSSDSLPVAELGRNCVGIASELRLLGNPWETGHIDATYCTCVSYTMLITGDQAANWVWRGSELGFRTDERRHFEASPEYQRPPFVRPTERTFASA